MTPDFIAFTPFMKGHRPKIGDSGCAAPPSTATIAQITGYRPAQIRDVLKRFAAEGLMDRVDEDQWILTAQGRSLRTMLRTGEDLRG